jgi:hypothetical protein
MKNLSILFSAMLLSYFSIAQDSKFEFGIQLGPNITNMRYASSTVQSKRAPQIAGTAGLFLQYNISNMFAIRTDPAFERLSDKSTEIIFTDPNGKSIGSGKMYFHYDYISVPILVRASIGNQVKFFLNAGPSLGFLFNQTTISELTTQTSKTKNTDRYQTLNFGITSGIGIALPVNEAFSLSLELRNNFGLSNISVSSNNNKAFKASTTSLLIGFSYKLGKSIRFSKQQETFSPTF